MTAKQTTLCFTLIICCILAVGHMNARDLKACTDTGMSTESCLAIYNP